MRKTSDTTLFLLHLRFSDPLRRAEYPDDFNPSSIVMDKEEVKTVQPRKFVVVLLLSELSGTKTN